MFKPHLKPSGNYMYHLLYQPVTESDLSLESAPHDYKDR
jgi:hypothetical protein